MQHCINALEMADVQANITLKQLILLLGWKHSKHLNLATGLETVKEFEFRLEELWETECSSDSDVDEVSLTNGSCHLTYGSVSSHLHKEF